MSSIDPATLIPHRAPFLLLGPVIDSILTADVLRLAALVVLGAAFTVAVVMPFRAWWTWMDPLDHVNHPQYVDFCDEAISVAMKQAGIAPLSLVPVAEEVTFRSGVEGGEEARVESVARGWTSDGAAVIAHRVLVGERLCATATTVRRVLGEIGESSLCEVIAGAAQGA